LSSPYLQYDSNGTFRNVPLLLSHACPCAGGFDGYKTPTVDIAPVKLYPYVKKQDANSCIWVCVLLLPVPTVPPWHIVYLWGETVAVSGFLYGGQYRTRTRLAGFESCSFVFCRSFLCSHSRLLCRLLPCRFWLCLWRKAKNKAKIMRWWEIKYHGYKRGGKIVTVSMKICHSRLSICQEWIWSDLWQAIHAIDLMFITGSPFHLVIRAAEGI